MHIRVIPLFAVFVFKAYPIATKPSSDCHECVYYSFEEDFHSLFSEDGICTRYEIWLRDSYERNGIAPPNENSRNFIIPQHEYSCATSFQFPLAPGGTVEVMVYMNRSYDTWWTYSDMVSVMAIEMTGHGSYIIHGRGVLDSWAQGFVNGWQTFSFQVLGTTTFDGHINFVGMSNPGSRVYVDAFCYKPPNYKGDCWAHDDLTTTAAPETTPVEIETTTEVAETGSTSAVTDSSVTESVNASETTIKPEVTTTTSTSTTVPEPTLPTPAPGSQSSCPEDQLIHWLLPHEKNCNLFYYCVWGEKVLRECPSGLHFNPELQVCDWPVSAGCVKVSQ